ncbi:glycoside hydrolase family 12 protein [Nemania sp. FL0031]|nr:glycoside hydrolase family 12 protein [Nemania sp. FL0031]
MKSQLLTLVALSPLAAYALPQHARRHGCGKPASSSTTTTVITTGILLTDIPSTFSVIPLESLQTTTRTFTTDYITEEPTTTVTTGLPLSEIPSFTAVPATSLPTSTFTTFTLATSTEGGYPVASPTTASKAIDATYAKATQIAFKVAAKQQCGNNDRLVLPGMPWTVANSMYNADQMVGKQCTNFDGILQTTDGTKVVEWTSVTDVELVEDTKDLCKGYTNIGIGVNLKKQLKDIKSIPAYYKWDRTNTTEFRGSNLFDFITAPTPDDTTSTATSEFMLWIRNWGNQVPIGYSRGPVATFDLFGTSWKLYEGKNPASGVTVRSMLVDENYDGEFQGDLKTWLDAMVQKGYIPDSDYVTVGNAGTEIFYGNAVMNATVALDIKV